MWASHWGRAVDCYPPWYIPFFFWSCVRRLPTQTMCVHTRPGFLTLLSGRNRDKSSSQLGAGPGYESVTYEPWYWERVLGQDMLLLAWFCFCFGCLFRFDVDGMQGCTCVHSGSSTFDAGLRVYERPLLSSLLCIPSFGGWGRYIGSIIGDDKILYLDILFCL